VGNARPSVLDLAFANPLLLPLVKSWESRLPSTCSDHIPITINLASPSQNQTPPGPRWADTDWEILSPIIESFKIPAAPPCPSPLQLDQWLLASLDRLVALLKAHTPVSKSSPYSKPWWSPHLTILRRESHKAVRTARKLDKPASQEAANTSKKGYSRPLKPLKHDTGQPFSWGPHPKSYGWLR